MTDAINLPASASLAKVTFLGTNAMCAQMGTLVKTVLRYVQQDVT